MRLAILAALPLALLSSPALTQPAQRAQLTAKFRERLTEIALAPMAWSGSASSTCGAASGSA